jgi:hypothetical protein
MDISSNINLITDLLFHRSETLNMNPGRHPMVLIIGELQSIMESLRGVVVFGWLKVKGHEILSLIRSCEDVARLFQMTPVQLLRLRNLLMLAMVGVGCLSALIAGLTIWWWLVSYGGSNARMPWSPYGHLPIVLHIGMWTSSSALLAMISRFLILIVAFLTLIMCLCASNLSFEIPDGEEILKNQEKLTSTLTEVRFKYLQLVTLANQISNKAGVAILWLLICDVVSICGQVARNFQAESQWFGFIFIIRSLVAGLGIMVCFVFAMHQPLISLHKKVRQAG